MKKMFRRFSPAVLAAFVFVLAACGAVYATNQRDDAYNQVAKKATHRAGYLPTNDVEWNNYNRAQKLYDDQSSIIWCTTTWGNASSPLVTIPIAGKLTSSSTSVFSPEHQVGDSDTLAMAPSMSVDGLYHPNPPQYRYGFTPGGQYVDFFGMPALCTTALMKFQRQSTKVTISIDPQARAAQAAAESALRSGNHAAAQAALAGLNG